MRMGTEHVPSWRKLGLKLRSEENGATNGLTSVSKHISKKRKLSPSSGGAEAKPVVVEAKGLHTSSAKTSLSPPRNGTSLPRSSASPSSSHKRKSVSFTPDTKDEDGARNPNIDYTPSSDIELSSNLLTSLDKQQRTSIEVELSPASKSCKAPKKPKKAKKLPEGSSQADTAPQGQGSDNSSKEYISPQLQYLITFNQDRSAWKFNKAKQNWLLKNVLDLSKIPETYTEALKKYLSTMEPGSATDRLHQTVSTFITEDDAALSSQANSEKSSANSEGVNSDFHRHNAYRRVIEAYISGVRDDALAAEEDALVHEREWRTRLIKRKRAEDTVWTLSDNAAAKACKHPEAGDLAANQAAVRQAVSSLTPGRITTVATSSTRSPSGQPQGSRRVRKRRTGIPDDDTDSSVTSSEDEGSSSSNAEEAAPAPTQPVAAPLQAARTVKHPSQAESASSEDSESSSEETNEDDESDED